MDISFKCQAPFPTCKEVSSIWLHLFSHISGSRFQQWVPCRIVSKRYPQKVSCSWVSITTNWSALCGFFWYIFHLLWSSHPLSFTVTVMFTSVIPHLLFLVCCTWNCVWNNKGTGLKWRDEASLFWVKVFSVLSSLLGPCRDCRTLALLYK